MASIRLHLISMKHFDLASINSHSVTSRVIHPEVFLTEETSVQSSDTEETPSDHFATNYTVNHYACLASLNSTTIYFFFTFCVSYYCIILYSFLNLICGVKLPGASSISQVQCELAVTIETGIRVGAAVMISDPSDKRIPPFQC